MIVSPIEQVIALMIPLECHICGREGDMLCLSCQMQVLPEHISRCYLCNKLTKQQRICTSCAPKSRLRRVWWLGLYKNTVKELIFEMKYHRKRAYARSFGRILSEHIPYLPDDTLVVPIPTASNRIRMRGFDQADLIAKQFAADKDLTFSPLLYRRTQVDQIGKNRDQRQQQIKQSIALHAKADIAGRTILLIDDVLTTGASLEAAAQLLRKNGARHVDAAVVARHLI